MSTYPAAPRPERLFDDEDTERRWRARFTAARVSLPDWADDAEHRTVYLSNASGVWEVYAWDRATDTHRKVTERPNGTMGAAIEPDGEHIWWFADTDGDEFGDWMREPFTDGEAKAALPGTHSGYPAGLALGRRVVSVGASTDDGTTIWVRREPGGVAEVVYSSEFDGGVAALSEDETLLAIGHSEHGDNRHPSLKVLRVADGAVLAEKHDGPGKGLDAIAFAPIAGDTRLLVGHERHGREELLLWDVATGEETELPIDLPGDIGGDWYPDGSALLVSHTHSGRDTLHRLDPATMELSTLDTRPGTVGSAHARYDGSIEYSWSDSATPPLVRSLAGGSDTPLLTPPGPRSPGSTPVTDVHVEGVSGPIHALVSRPDGAADGPLPTVFSIHGGPHAADEDRFSAYRAVWLDAGFAVVAVNYRGSTGYGSAWRDAIEGRPGLTELEDIAAVHEWAVREGLADPRRCVVNGASWGGYLALLALGTQPDRWAAGVAAVPVADYHAAYADEMEPLRAFDRALFGGSPAERPDVYTKCSPLTYVDEVTAPVLVLAGDNDPRCPIRQIHNYLDRLAERGVAFETYFYDAGHGSLVVSEVTGQTAVEVDFTRRMLATGK